MNLVDFLAILPYVISICLESLEDLRILGKAGKIMRLVRVMRILRIFKLVRHFAGLQSLLYTLKQVSCIKFILLKCLNRCVLVMSRAEKVPSQAELGHFNLRAETELNYFMHL